MANVLPVCAENFEHARALRSIGARRVLRPTPDTDREAIHYRGKGIVRRIKKAGQRPLGRDQQVSFKLLKLTVHQPRGSHRSDH
jgi:hypothetical protein